MMKRIAVRLSLAVCALLVAATPALAHSHPTKMSPEKEATVSAPKEISVEFSEGLEPKFSSLTLLDDKGTVVSKVPSVLDPADNKHMTLALPSLVPGVYTVKWVTASTDGHNLAGSYNFTVAAGLSH
jgi:methionine-rich copper-binding protein CopC